MEGYSKHPVAALEGGQGVPGHWDMFKRLNLLSFYILLVRLMWRDKKFSLVKILRPIKSL